MTTEEQAQVDRLISNAKAMKPFELEKFVENISSGDGNTEIKEAILNGIEDFQTARTRATVEMSDELKDDEK